MRIQAKTVYCVLLLAAALSSGSSAFAFISIDTELQLESDHIYGNCVLVISDNEPYSAFNSNCNLDRNDITIYGHSLPGYEIGYPRSGTLHESWHLLTPAAPQANARYCARFGTLWGVGDPLRVEWGHYSNPTLNIVTEGDETCETAEPQVKAYFQTFCLGSFVWVYSVDSLIPGVHLSYRIPADSLICFAVATRPDT